MSLKVGLASRGLRKQPSSLSAPKLFFAFAHLESRSVFYDRIYTTIDGVKMEAHSLIEPNSWVTLRLPNGTNRLLQIIPNMYDFGPSLVITHNCSLY